MHGPEHAVATSFVTVAVQVREPPPFADPLHWSIATTPTASPTAVPTVAPKAAAAASVTPVAAPGAVPLDGGSNKIRGVLVLLAAAAGVALVGARVQTRRRDR